MWSMYFWLYKSASLTLTSGSGSLKESTWDNTKHPTMAFPRSGHRKSHADQDQVTRGNVLFFLSCKAVSVIMRYVSDYVMTKSA